MRVIAGTARSLPLKTAEGMETRPTTDRIKETLFNMLNNRLAGCRFLDLFAGSGAIGIEALSRGAAQAVFVENNERALRCIRENLAFTHLEEYGVVRAGEVLSILSVLEREAAGPFDFVFLDPPYKEDWAQPVCMALCGGTLIDEDTQIIVETALHADFSWTKDIGLAIQKEKKYKTNKHVWLRKEQI